jgi:TRAP-type C4-dicarboxylate transport system substrate-binding protein
MPGAIRAFHASFQEIRKTAIIQVNSGFIRESRSQAPLKIIFSLRKPAQRISASLDGTGFAEGRIAMNKTTNKTMHEQSPAKAAVLLTAALLLSFPLMLFGERPSAAEEWNFYMHQSAPNFATSRGAQRFVEEIDKATDGKLTVKLHLAGTLQINPSNITQAVGENVVQIADDLFNSGNILVAGIPRLPMLVQSYDDFAKADAALKPYLEKAFAQKGVTLLASYTYPLQFAWGRKKIESLDDIKGLKFRVAQPEQGEFVRRFGGTSITMSAPEVPSALDRGVVDGIFTAGVGAVLWKDLLKYGYVLIVNVNNSYYIANTEAFNKLSPDLQGKLRQAAEDAARWDQETMQKEETDSVKILSDMGYTFTKATPDDVSRAVTAMKPYWDEWAGSRGPDAVEALAKVRAALGR